MISRIPAAWPGGRTAFELLDEYRGVHGISVRVLGSEDPAIWPLPVERRTGRAGDRSSHPPDPLST